MYKYLSHIITIFTFTVVVYTPAIAITYYSRTSGDWDAASTWSTVGCGGVAAASIPGPSDDVIICVGHIVAMIDNPGDCYSLTISGTASWKQASTTNVGAGGLIMDGGTITTSGQTGTLAVTGTFTTSGTNNIGECNITVSGLTTISTIINITSATGTKTFTDLTISGTLNNTANSDIYINGNLQNNGTFTIGTGRVTFGGATSNTVTGSSTTAFNTITINKGTSSSNVLDIQSLITMTDGGLTLTNGTFKLTGASTIVPFTVNLADPFLIPATCALWCNGGTINTPAMNWNVAGELRISAGTVNLGTASDNRFIAENDGTAKLTIEGGTFNVAGRISRGTATDFLTFTMTNGTIVVPTVGCTAAGLAPIMMDLAGSSFTMSGGTMIIRRSGATNLGFTANAGTVGITGGVIQFGDASTPASQTMLMNCTFSIANLTVNSANATCQLATGLTVLQAVNITAGTLNTATSNMTVGGSWTNNSTFTPGSNTVTFNGTGTQTITKTEGETFNNLTINKTSGTVILAYNINVNNTLTMTQGNIDCQSYTLTLGTGLGSTGTLTYTAGTIIGNFKRWVNSTGVAILFPIGTASYYRPASINFTNLTGGTLTANFVASDPGSSGLPYTDGSRTVVNQFTEGYWVMIATDGLASTNYYLECTGNGFTSYTIGASTRLMYRTTSGDPWSANGTHTDASGNTAKRTGVSGLSAQFAFGKPSCSPYVATSITGNTSVCISTTEAYSVNASEPANTYTWTITGGAVASGQGTPNITVNWGAVGMLGSVQVVEKNDCGDDNSPVTQSVYIHPIATSSITGVTSVAINETNVAYSVTNTPGYSYAWSLPLGGGTIDPPGTGNAITIDWGGTAGSYSVRVDVTRLCGSDDFQTLSVTVRGVIQSDQSGNWTLSSTWIGGNTPTATDYVEIQAAHTVTMNGNSGACRRLTINGTATWSATRTTDVGDGGVIINSTGNITGTGAGILTTTGGLSGISNSNISSTTVTIRLQTNSQNISSDGAVNILDITTTATNTGTLSIGNSGTLSGAGTLTQSANSTLNMNGTTFSLTTLNASASGNTVNYGANADQTIKPVTYNNLSVSGTGTKTLDGATAINGNLNISAAAATLDVSTSNHALTVGGNWSNAGGFNERYGSVTLNGSTTQTITNSAGETFNNLVFSSAGTKQLNNDVVINFNFTNSSPVQAGTSDMQVLGDWDNSGSYSADNDVTFSGTTTIMGASTTTFKNIIINGTVTGHATNMIVTGNFTNNGTFNHNNGKVTFTGTTTIGGTTISTFKDVDIQGTVTGPAGNMNVAGNWANSGAFNHGNGTVTFNSTTAMSGSGTHSFNNVTVSGTLTAPSGNVNIASNFQNSGTFNHGSGTVTFNGTSEISGTTDATFNNVVISSTLTGKSAGNFNVQGNFTNDGTFSHNSGTVTFNGTNSILGGSATVTTFNNMAVSSSKAAEVSSGKAITTDGTLTVDGLLTLKSPASDDATASLITNGSVAGAGDVKVERYVSSGRWWYVATAISDGTSGIYSAASYPTHKFYY
ncbi:MAG: hypothetical protein HY738_04250, partial [Bacteroidia bacterium]|nr:hypothetical protein [Bacteroidia bacterium]